tara:strand:- start:127 stop:717 length:591 start_codon:yes stop_codon:yes gene_type:complete
MRFSSQNVSSIHEALQELSAPQTQIQLMTEADLDEITQLFSNPEFYSGIDMQSAPSKERLHQLLYERARLLLWRVFPFDGEKRDKQIGLVGWNGNAGPPCVVYFPSTDEVDLNVFHNAILLVVNAFFTMTEGEKLHIYLSHPIAEELHDRVVEAGFDLWQEYPGVDPEIESTYIMERQTFTAYYLEDHDEQNDEPY